MTDNSQRFLFDNTDIRGELVRLKKSFQQVASNHNYPQPVLHLLGEFMVAAALLSSTIKFEGTLILQARSEAGEIPLIMAEASSEQTIRAIARGAENASSEDFRQLLKNGQLCITIEPHNGHRYQGIVALVGDNLARCLEQYFEQSEQLSTRIWLACDGNTATGMLLQELPASEKSQQENREVEWQHASHLANTISRQELLELDFDQLLHRLYHQEPLRLFDAVTWSFQCSCNRDKTVNVLLTAGRTELEDILSEEGQIIIACEFCHQQYRFDEKDIKSIFDQAVH